MNNKSGRWSGHAYGTQSQANELFHEPQYIDLRPKLTPDHASIILHGIKI